jgi:hypothetical protein
MKLKKVNHGKSSAQAMVEFAIVLPILLMLLYGILETGRLMFIYSTVVTASRQAARYGSATGTGTGGVPRYQDCAGIRLAANKADYLNAFDHTGSDIVITYDNGFGVPVTTFDGTCDGATDTGVAPSTTNITRIKVTIYGDFFPLVRRLVPFIERSVGNGRPIIGESARTILKTITIVVATNTPTNTATFTPSPSPSPTRTNTPSRTPTASRTPTRTSTVTGTPPTATRTPTASSTPTRTSTPSLTPTRTATVVTNTATPLTNCNATNITHGPLTLAGGTLSMTITNSTGAVLTMQDVTLIWNNDKGHISGADKTLRLRQASLGSNFWSGNVYASLFTITTSQTIPTGTSTIIFTFHQSYDNLDGTERITINLATNGCSGFVIDSNVP